MIPITILLCLFAYLSGSLPFGIIFTRLFSRVELTSGGSKNIGAHNVLRLAGKKLAVLTLSGDLLKGTIPVLLGIFRLDVSIWQGEVCLGLVALSAFAGHLFSIFLGFRGGKGVATAAGCFLALSPMTFLVCLMVYILVLCASGYSSAGSVSAATVLPFSVWLFTHSVPLSATAIIMAVVICIRHWENIKRLRKGTEDSPFHPRR